MTDPISAQITINARRGGYGQSGGRLIMTMADHIDAQAATIKALVEALRDMRGLFSADGVLLKGRHLNATLALAEIALAAAKEPT